MKVAFAFFFLFIEGVEDQVRLLVSEQDYCTNSRLNIEDKKKKNTHLNDKWIIQRYSMLRDLRHRVMNIELRLRNLMVLHLHNHVNLIAVSNHHHHHPPLITQTFPQVNPRATPRSRLL